MASRPHLTSMHCRKRLNLSQVSTSSMFSYYLMRHSNKATEFYFNFPSSIFDELVPSISSQSWQLPFQHIIATPLLPCGEANSEIKKFTGNEEIGKAQDNMIKAIHAFMHFSVIYSQQNLLFCDLQGMFNPTCKFICMLSFWRQVVIHTVYSSENPKLSVYWNRGVSKIKKFLDKHSSACNKNWVCKLLQLNNIVIQTKTPELSPKVV